MAVRFQMVNNSATDYPIDILKDLRGLKRGVSYGMEMVRHNDVSIDVKAAGCSGFIESFASDGFYPVSSKNWQAIFRYRGEIESRSVS